MRLTSFLSIATVILALSSCSAPKNVTYLQDLKDGFQKELSQQQEITVKPNDKLSIIVNSKDPLLASLFNLPIVSHRADGAGYTNSSGLSSTQYVSYYTVNNDGFIDFPVIGEIHVAGMSRAQLASYIKKRLISDDYVKDPTVTVEFINAAITVLGEVQRPGRHTLERDRITLLEGIGLAGDLNILGDRKHVIVMRETDGKQTSYVVDLTNAESLLNSPVYNLQQNDVIYVAPNSMRKRQASVNGNTALSASFWVSVASLLTSVAVLIFK